VLLRLTLFVFMTVPLLAAMQLHQEYSYSGSSIYSTTLFPHLEDKFILFNISKNRTSYRVKSSHIQKLFSEQNLTVDTQKVRYVNFIKESPVDTVPISQLLKKRYENFYENIHVKNVIITPRSYLSELSNDFQLLFNEKNFKHAEGVLSIKTTENERIFFDYRIDATIDVFSALHPMKRGETLSALNTLKKTVVFDSFNALPLEEINPKEYRLKRSVKKDHLITFRDIESYPIVKKGNSVSVQMQSGTVIVEFSAVASQDGSKNDIISIQKKDGRRIKARVIAPGRVEIQ
jgi:flagella basal body P-ring formation protein FlgA